MATKEELLEKMKEGVIEYEEDQVKDAAQEWVDGGHVALEGIMDGLAAGMEVVGDLYEKNEYSASCTSRVTSESTSPKRARPRELWDGRGEVRGQRVELPQVRGEPVILQDSLRVAGIGIPAPEGPGVSISEKGHELLEPDAGTAVEGIRILDAELAYQHVAEILLHEVTEVPVPYRFHVRWEVPG